MKELSKKIISQLTEKSKSTLAGLRWFSELAIDLLVSMFTWIILFTWNVLIKIILWGSAKWIYRGVKWLCITIYDMFKKTPAQLTYWHDGEMNVVEVDDFVELAPNLIQYEDIISKKRVKIKAEYPIKYILKEQ